MKDFVIIETLEQQKMNSFFYSCSCSKYIHMRAVFEINKYTYMYIAYSNKIYVFNCHFSIQYTNSQSLHKYLRRKYFIIFYFVYVLNIVSKVEEDLIQVLKAKRKILGGTSISVTCKCLI